MMQTLHLTCLGIHLPQDLYLEHDGSHRRSVTGRARSTCHLLLHHLLHHRLRYRLLWFHLKRHSRRRLYHRQQLFHHLHHYHRLRLQCRPFRRRPAQEQVLEWVMEQVLE
jgi:hypothetical protein